MGAVQDRAAGDPRDSRCAGYPILDGASMPVVGDPETVNNTYLEQIVMSAKAAIGKAAEMGVTDPKLTRTCSGRASRGAGRTTAR